MVRYGCQRLAALPGRGERSDGQLEGVPLHLQYRLLQLPRKPALDELRSQTDTYDTRWAEPGINCETCHGSSVEHNKIAKASPKGQPLPELRIIRTKTMTKQQRSDLCSSCHAKASPLTLEYKPENGSLTTSTS